MEAVVVIDFWSCCCYPFCNASFYRCYCCFLLHFWSLSLSASIALRTLLDNDMFYWLSHSVSDILTYFICTNKFVFINWCKKTKGYNKMHRITLILFELGRSILRHFCIIVLCTCLSPMTVSMSLLNILNKSDVCSCCTVVCLLECDLRSVWCFVFT